jgi:uncharacterized protein YjbI with pentapeptide repeats
VIVTAVVVTAAAFAVPAASGSSAREAAPLALVVGLIALGAALAFASSGLRENTIEVGRGLFVSGLLALALLWVQDNLEDRDLRRQQQETDRTRAAEARERRNADRESLQLTIGMARSLQGIDLRDRQLDGFSLAAKNLRGAQFQGATARRANLTRANLSDATVREADFRDATLIGATLTGRRPPSSFDLVDFAREFLSTGASTDPAQNLVTDADFSHADLSGADLKYITGTAPSFLRANLENADLRRSRLDGPVFRNARLIKARARRADFSEGDFRDAMMYGADLRGAVLWSVDMRDADLCGATLRRADLAPMGSGLADLRGADLRGADLRTTGLKFARLKGARFDSSTRWPERFPVLESGAINRTRHAALTRKPRARSCRRGNEDDYLDLLLEEPCVEVGPRPLEPPPSLGTWFEPIAGPEARDALERLRTRPRPRSEYECYLGF